MKVLVRTGLVPVKALKPFGNHRVKQVFGVKPEVAKTGVEEGNLELVPIPEGAATFDAPGPSEKAPEPVKVVEQSAITIPEGFDKEMSDGGMHPLRRVQLAKLIKPGHTPLEGHWTVEAADSVIRDEIQRRAAAVTPPAE